MHWWDSQTSEIASFPAGVDWHYNGHTHSCAGGGGDYKNRLNVWRKIFIFRAQSLGLSLCPESNGYHLCHSGESSWRLSWEGSSSTKTGVHHGVKVNFHCPFQSPCQSSRLLKKSKSYVKKTYTLSISTYDCIFTMVGYHSPYDSNNSNSRFLEHHCHQRHNILMKPIQ